MSHKHTKVRILVAEHEKFWVDLLKIDLKDSYPQIEIVHARDEEEAIALVKKSLNLMTSPHSVEESQEPFDAIITGIEAPIMDGAKIVRTIRDLLYTGPIIVWTAHRNASKGLKKALSIPVNGFCIKEISVANLIEHLRNLQVLD